MTVFTTFESNVTVKRTFCCASLFDWWLVWKPADQIDKKDRLPLSRAHFKNPALGAVWLNVQLWVLIGQHLKLNESQCFISICACHSPYHGLHARLLVQIVKDKALSCCFLSQSIERITNKNQTKTKLIPKKKTLKDQFLFDLMDKLNAKTQ